MSAGGARQPIGYRFVRRLARLLLDVFYRQIEVVGRERIPLDRPLILAANHQNALVDPMILMAAISRRLRPLAKAPLFAHPLIGPFLRLAGAIPVHRRKDAGSDPAGNVAMFKEVREVLRAGGAMLVFPEGVSQPEPALMPLRTGAARMLLGAQSEVTLLPVGLVYHEPGSFRSGRAIVLVGEPVRTDDAVDLQRRDPEQAMRLLTDRLAGALQRLIVEAGDRETLRLLRIVESIARQMADAQEARRDPQARTAWMQRALRAYGYLEEHDPQRARGFRLDVELYALDLERAGLSGGQLSRVYPASLVLRYAVREGLPLVLGLPLALWGIVNHFIPFAVTALLVRLARPEPDAVATYKLSGSLLLYPLFWIAQAFAAWRLGGGWLLGLYLASLIPTGFFALTWRERLGRFAREARGFLSFLLNRDLRRRLAERHHAISEELAALARVVPEAVRQGRQEGR